MFCTVRIHILSVSCPGVRLGRGSSEAYLSIDLIDRYLYTRALPPVFPLPFEESFEISKAFPMITNTDVINKWLRSKRVWLKLFLSNARGCDVLIASYETSAWDFLFPTYAKFHLYEYGCEIFMQPTHHFPGHIHPKLSFTTWTCMGQLPCCGEDNLADDCAVNLSVVNRMLSCKGQMCAKGPLIKSYQESGNTHAPITKFAEHSSYYPKFVSMRSFRREDSDAVPTEPKTSIGTQWEPQANNEALNTWDFIKKPELTRGTRLNESSCLSYWRRRFGLYPAVTQREVQMIHIPIDPYIN